MVAALESEETPMMDVEAEASCCFPEAWEMKAASDFTAKIDLDTIVVNNLNRKFLFRQSHVGQSKSKVALDAVLKFRSYVSITPYHANIKDPDFNVDFFKDFNVVLNGLDNLDDRQHVNRLCLAAGVQLIESGTTGFLGQVTVHVKGRTECYECQPKPTPKTYHVCTITSTPSKHKNDEDLEQYGRKIFDHVFGYNIELTLSNEDSWKKRNRPRPIYCKDVIPSELIHGNMTQAKLSLPGDLSSVSAMASLGLKNPQDIWSLKENSDVFLEALKLFFSERGEEIGNLSFDKDDQLAVEIVTTAANIRASSFGVPLHSLFEAKGVAGNIVHDVATTNAIIVGLIMIEAIKVLQKDTKNYRWKTL